MKRILFIALLGIMAMGLASCSKDNNVEEYGTDDPSGYKMFTSVSSLTTWLAQQPVNTPESVHKVGLKNINLDNGNNWGDLGRGIKTGQVYIDLDLTNCKGTAIPDGYQEQENNYPYTTTTTYGVFIENDYITAIKLPATLKTVGKWAFKSCTYLNSVALPEGLTGIHAHAFDNCLRLKNISLPKTLKKIGVSAFETCRQLPTVTIPASVTEWEYHSFSGCTLLQSVTIEEGVKVIGEHAFRDCIRLHSLTLPESIERIEKGAFRHCASLKKITVPDKVTAISDLTFHECRMLSEIVLPQGIKSIGEHAFAKCWELQSINLPASLETIDKYAFDDCYNLSPEMEIPDKVKEIGQNAFDGSSISTFIMRPAMPPALGYTALNTSVPFASLLIKVPAESLDKYKNAGGEWDRYKDRIVPNTK